MEFCLSRYTTDIVGSSLIKCYNYSMVILFNRTIEVVLEQSILRGNKICKQIISIGE